MNTSRAGAPGCFRNAGRELALVESELARRLRLLGIAADDRDAIRRLFGPAAASQAASTIPELLGLGLILAKLLRHASSAGSEPWLGPTTRTFMAAMRGLAP